jgi:hypothetical protein
VEPTDANVASGQDVILHCQADGYPVPSITWRKAVGTFICVIFIAGHIDAFTSGGSLIYSQSKIISRVDETLVNLITVNPGVR